MADEIRNALTVGKLTVFSQGSYSDYCYRGCYVALQTLSLEGLNALVADKLADEKDRGKINCVEVMLIREGYLLEVDLTEVCLGDYFTLEITIE